MISIYMHIDVILFIVRLRLQYTPEAIVRICNRNELFGNNNYIFTKYF